MRTYKTEFPRFGELEVVIPKEFEDSSWCNDTSPSFSLYLKGEKNSEERIILWVDYKDPSEREMGTEHYGVSYYDANGDFVESMGTDDWAEATAYAEKLRAKYANK